MSRVDDDLGLEASPSVPGGGPASRWRASRVPSRVFRGWLLLLAVALGVLAAVIAAWVRHGITDTGIGLFVALTITLPLLLAGIGVAVGAANDTRVDDDMRTYGVGIRSALHADGDAERPFEFDGRPAGTVSRPGKRAGRSRKDRREGRSVVVGTEERWLEQRGTTFQLLDGRETVATARPAAHGPWRDWEIEVDGRLLRLRTRAQRHPPRRTLLDDRGRAWRADVGRRRITARLPEELTPVGAAFVLAVLAAIRDTVEPVPGAGSGGGVYLADDGWGWLERD
ncbi:hypothetical protein GCM10023201_48100 [Actinomycetospora corticicola]|uniref:Uncharacterized protein n=1 Tax=Actinomycetospora corticicola TaxID=663602 RepID=A0A7Y9J7D5_9PSEU|nr:hypothetical protein [Actinomycetospora corticicola]NYD37926.1 hypothetical protein [Actinomycetospora corticicola]